METGKDYEILITNLQPFFWPKIKNIIRQNQKGALLEFLFGKATDNKLVNQAFNDKIQNLQNQINSLAEQVERLQQKVINLEAKLGNSKYLLSDPSQPLESSKTTQQENSTLKDKNGSYLTENESEVRNPTYQTKNMKSKRVSESSKIDFKTSSTSEHYKSLLNQKKALNEDNFITLKKITEQERIEIIKLGFQLNQEGKISLKKYYESKDPASLFQLKGYSIKYESIRRTSIYKSLKE